MTLPNSITFAELLPETILTTVTQQGFAPTGALSPLNSYENRVYEIGLDEREPIIAKYYRPGRCRAETIEEEHRFIHAAQQLEIPVVVPLPLKHPLSSIETLGEVDGIYYAFFPKFRGREHPDITNEDRKWLGRTLGRLHNVGESFVSKHRLPLNPKTYGYDSFESIMRLDYIPSDILPGLKTYLTEALRLTDPYFQKTMKTIALHGDCHPGNILWNKDGPHLLDFDDMVIAPPVQDIWMLFHGDDEEKRAQKEAFFEGYEIFRKFEKESMILIEPLRTLRMIRHAAWIGHRHSEPAFQWAFPYYRERKYWEEFLQSIKEQVGVLQEM